jgi:4,5-dihydroxyphthalate decarboxylase
MMNLELTAAFTPNPLTAPVLEHAVVPAHITWAPEGVGPGDLFFRQLKFGDFDVSELSMSSLTIGISQGNRTWVALPIFTTRAFYHTEIIVREGSTISSPAELRGGRVGVLEYQQTSVVWIRGILENEFGLSATELQWFMQRRPEQSHGGATGFAPPPGVRLSYVPTESSLAAMLADGVIDAILFHPPMLDGIDHKDDGGRERLRYRPLFPDPHAEAARYYAKTGIVPVNHTVVVRRSILEEHPEIAGDIYEAFNRAHNNSIAPYGVQANQQALETLMQYLHDQQLTRYRVPLEEVFAPPSIAW